MNLKDLGFCRDKKDAGKLGTAQENAQKGKGHDFALQYANHYPSTAKSDEVMMRHELLRRDSKLQEPLTTKEQPDEKQLLLGFVQSKILKTSIAKNDSNKVCCLVESNDSKQTIELCSSDATSWLVATYYKETSKIVSDESCSQVLNLLKSMAKLERIPSEIVRKRTAFVNDVLYYDRCNDSMELVRIAPDSIKIVKHGEDTPLFQRNSNRTGQVTQTLILALILLLKCVSC